MPWQGWATIFVVVLVTVVFPAIRALRKRKILKDGEPVLALVLSVTQTGVYSGPDPTSRVRLRIEQAGAPTREVELTQNFLIANLPRVGDAVYLKVDRIDPTRVAYMGLASEVTLALPAQSGTQKRTPNQIQDLYAITTDLITNYKLHIGTVTATEIVAPSVKRYTVLIDSVTAPKRSVSLEQMMTGEGFTTNDRVYLFVSKSDPNSFALQPPSMTGGQKMSITGDKPGGDFRLDTTILGPQILVGGKQASAQVLTAAVDNSDEAWLRSQGMQRREVKLHVTPADGTPAFEDESSMWFFVPAGQSSPVEQGSTIPLRLDVNNDRRYALDTLACGLPDQYAAYEVAYKLARQNNQV